MKKNRYISLSSDQIRLLVEMLSVASSYYFTSLSRRVLEDLGSPGVPKVFEKFTEQIPLHKDLHQALWDGWTIAVSSKFPYTFDLPEVLVSYLVSILNYRQYPKDCPAMLELERRRDLSTSEVNDLVQEILMAFEYGTDFAPKVLYQVTGPKQEQ